MEYELSTRKLPPSKHFPSGFLLNEEVGKIILPLFYLARIHDLHAVIRAKSQPSKPLEPTTDYEKSFSDLLSHTKRKLKGQPHTEILDTVLNSLTITSIKNYDLYRIIKLSKKKKEKIFPIEFELEKDNDPLEKEYKLLQNSTVIKKNNTLMLLFQAIQPAWLAYKQEKSAKEQSNGTSSTTIMIGRQGRKTQKGKREKNGSPPPRVFERGDTTLPTSLPKIQQEETQKPREKQRPRSPCYLPSLTS